jgi:hypothetical protein
MTGEMLRDGIEKAAPCGHGLLFFLDEFAVMSGLVWRGAKKITGRNPVF